MLLRLLAGLFNRFSVPWQRRVLALRIPRFFVGVAALCIEENRVLLARHRFGDPRWRLPGGFLQRSETIEQAVTRELREELGCDAEVLGILEVSAGYRYPRVEVVLRCRLAAPPRPDPTEIVEARYFGLDALPPIRADQRRLIETELSPRSS